MAFLVTQAMAAKQDLDWYKMDLSMYTQAFLVRSQEKWCRECQSLHHTAGHCPLSSSLPKQQMMPDYRSQRSAEITTTRIKCAIITDVGIYTPARTAGQHPSYHCPTKRSNSHKSK